jgi:hypothetical protein
MRTYVVTVKTIFRIEAKDADEAGRGGERLIRDSLPYGIPRDILSERVRYPATVSTVSVK